MNRLTITSALRRSFAVAGVAVAACERTPDPLVPAETAVATSLTAVTPVTLSDTVGIYLDQPPAVVALDRNGNPVPGIVVQFVVTDGGGYIHRAGKHTDGWVTTSETGIAVMPGWRLGVKPGLNKVSAASGKLVPVIFTALTVPSLYRTARIVAGHEEVALPRSAVGIPPSVAVLDTYGNPIEGAAVDFAVTMGGGSLEGATRVTNSDGIATATSWTLGTIGRQEVTATFPGTIDPVVITALAVEAVDPSCGIVHILPLASTTSRDLGAGSCRTSAGRFFDLHSVTVTADGVYRFLSRSSDFDSFIELFDSTGARVGQNDNLSGSSSDSEIEAYLVKGTYALSVASLSPIATGNYAVSLGAADVTGCDVPAIVTDIVVSAAVRYCPEPPWGYSTDRYRIYLRKAQTLSMRLEFLDGFMEPTLKITNAAGTTFAHVVNADYLADDISLAWVAPADGYYIVAVADLPPGFNYALHVK